MKVSTKSQSTERLTVLFDPSAAATWVEVSNFLEQNIGPMRIWEPIADYVSKVSENIARVAALIAYFEFKTTVITDRILAHAIEIVKLYFNEFERIFGRSSQFDDQNDVAISMLKWICEWCRLHPGNNHIPISYVYKNSPIRTRKLLDELMPWFIQRSIASIWSDQQSSFYTPGLGNRRKKPRKFLVINTSCPQLTQAEAYRALSRIANSNYEYL